MTFEILLLHHVLSGRCLAKGRTRGLLFVAWSRNLWYFCFIIIYHFSFWFVCLFFIYLMEIRTLSSLLLQQKPTDRLSCVVFCPELPQHSHRVRLPAIWCRTQLKRMMLREFLLRTGSPRLLAYVWFMMVKLPKLCFHLLHLPHSQKSCKSFRLGRINTDYLICRSTPVK